MCGNLKIMNFRRWRVKTRVLFIGIDYFINIGVRLKKILFPCKLYTFLILAFILDFREQKM